MVDFTIEQLVTITKLTIASFTLVLTLGILIQFQDPDLGDARVMAREISVLSMQTQPDTTITYTIKDDFSFTQDNNKITISNAKKTSSTKPLLETTAFIQVNDQTLTITKNE